MSKRSQLVIAGGGTGGHFYCGLALAQKYLKQYPSNNVLFVGVAKGIEARHRFDDKRMKLKLIRASGFKNVNIFKKFEAVLFLLESFIVCCLLLLKVRPKKVIGVGGYASAPVVSAAVFLKFFLGIRVIVMDQNSVPGLVNRIFSKVPFVEAYSPFPASGFLTTEMPIREHFEELKAESQPPQWPPKKILIMGGSQGAAGLNKAWINMLPQLKQLNPDFEFIHQAGSAGLDFVRSAYEDLRMKATCFDFSNELASYIKDADLVFSRSGALSCFELIFLARPSVFIPFPHAADDHQFKNARAVQDVDWIISEREFSWNRVHKILTASKPKIPSPKARVQASLNRIVR